MAKDNASSNSNSHDKSDRCKKKARKLNNKTKELEYKKNGSDGDSDDDGEWITEDDTELDQAAYHKLLSEMFPSKHMTKKAKKSKALKKKHAKNNSEPRDDVDEHNGELDDDTRNMSDKNKSKRRKKNCKKRTTSRAQTDKENDVESDHDSERSNSDESDWEYDEDYDDDMDSDEEAELEALLGGGGRNSKFNIIFTIADQAELSEDEEYDSDNFNDSDYSEDSSQHNDSDYHDSEDCSKDTERRITRSMSKNNNSAAKENALDDSDDNDCANSREEKKSKKKKQSLHNSNDDDQVALNYLDNIVKNMPEELQDNPIISEMTKTYQKKKKEHQQQMRKKEKKRKAKNISMFKKKLKDRNVMNDSKFFKDKLTIKEQELVLRQIDELKKHCDVEKPYRLALLDADIPVEFKACAYKKLSTLRYMEPGGGEYYKIKNWVDTFMRLPFGKYKTLPLTIEDGIEKCHTFMERAKNTLDKAVYGLNDSKLQIMQMVGQWITNPTAVGSAIAIKGPMGTGKTTLVKEGISKILGRDFAFIALGGATDSSFLEGHSYTYEGSTWGKIVDILLQCKCMNPVIYFDELDKVSDTPKGEEIIGILTHLTDTSQNSKFHDKYFAELDFDLSRCLFIFSYNDESKVNPILKDRMYRIQTKGYSDDEKITIARDYLLPNIREQVKFDTSEVTIPDDVLKHIIANYTDKEDGVRNLKRCLEIIHTKLNLYRLMKPGTNLFEEDMKLEVTFPLTATVEIVESLIKKKKTGGNWQHMYM